MYKIYRLIKNYYNPVPKEYRGDRRLINSLIYQISLNMPLDAGIEIRRELVNMRHTFIGQFLWKND